MAIDHTGEEGGTERWDQLYKALSAEPRRMIIYSLLNEPRGRRLPLPDAAWPPNLSVDSETLNIQLQHHHLPILAAAEYIRWEEDPFCVQRGLNFEEPAFIIDKVMESVGEIPKSLIDDCVIL